MIDWKGDIKFHLLLLILLVSGLLRFYDFASFSLSNDELSAIFRLDYRSFSELISKGVIETEPHPAGSQIFLFYWTKLFGISAASVRFPFILFGIIGLVFMFLTFETWFGKYSALLSTGLFAVMEFSTIYGHLARPYAMGFMTVMIMTWAWTHLIFNQSKRKYHLLAFALAAAASCYAHYFAALMVGIIGLSGIYPAYKRGVLKIYLLLGITAFLLFAPHLKITFHQVGRGAVTSWITAPDKDFVWHHISWLLNESFLLMALAALFLFLTIFLISRKEKMRLVFVFYSLFFFISPILIGYLYSEFVGVVLMNRVLYFSAPFLFAVIFSHIPAFDQKTFMAIFSLILIAGVFSTVFEKKLFERSYTENFKALAYEVNQIQNSDEMANTLMVGNFNSTKYINYYLPEKYDDFELSNLESDSNLVNYIELVDRSNMNNLSLFYACKYQPIASIEYAKWKFGALEREEIYHNSGMWHFQKPLLPRDTLLFNSLSADTGMFFSQEYVDLYKANLEDASEIEVINIRAYIESDDIDNVLLVYSLSDKDSNPISWKGHKLSDFKNHSGHKELFMSFKMEGDKYKNAQVSIYFWNPDRKNVFLKDVSVSSFKDSHYPTLY